MAQLLEVCVDSLASARAAITGGADRLEVCSALETGGLTPYVSLVRKIRAESSIPLRCLMRPRSGDFLLDEEDVAMLCEEILQLRTAGADGFVLGGLCPDGRLDRAALRPLLDACGTYGKTLHRCIDVSLDPIASYRQAADLGFDTVLTSGAAACCTDGLSILRTLVQLRDELHGPEILVCAGVNADVIAALKRQLPELRAFHMSGKTLQPSRMAFRREGVPMGSPALDEWHRMVTSEMAVRCAKQALLEA